MHSYILSEWQEELHVAQKINHEESINSHSKCASKKRLGSHDPPPQNNWNWNNWSHYQYTHPLKECNTQGNTHTSESVSEQTFCHVLIFSIAALVCACVFWQYSLCSLFTCCTDEDSSSLLKNLLKQAPSCGHDQNRYQDQGQDQNRGQARSAGDWRHLLLSSSSSSCCFSWWSCSRIPSEVYNLMFWLLHIHHPPQD